jgi:crotonobetaine/carnitine-CoA ligase
MKDMIKVGGESVSASEVEAAIMASGVVRETAVVSRPDKIYGEVTVAFVVLREDAAADAVAAIDAHCRKSLAKFKVPRSINTVSELPRIGNNKVHRPALREMARAEIEAAPDGVAKTA